MPYAVVQDVPASWEQYQRLAAVLREHVPDGLIFHLAGPTDEGYRTIDVWDTREAWERFTESPGRPRHEWAVPTLRELRALSAIASTPIPAFEPVPDNPTEEDA